MALSSLLLASAKLGRQPFMLSTASSNCVFVRPLRSTSRDFNPDAPPMYTPTAQNTPSRDEIMKLIYERYKVFQDKPRRGVWPVKAAKLVKIYHINRGDVPVGLKDYSGKFHHIDALQPRYVVPDLTNCELKPYVQDYAEETKTQPERKPVPRSGDIPKGKRNRRKLHKRIPGPSYKYAVWNLIRSGELNYTRVVSGWHKQGIV